MTETIIELIEEIDDSTRKGYAEGKVDYATYVQITESVKKLRAKFN